MARPTFSFAWPGPLDPGSPKSHQRPRLGGPNLETCTSGGVQTWKRQRFGGSKPGNLHVLGCPNLETCTFWQVQTWKPTRFLETSTFWGVQTWKPARFWTWKPARFGGSKPGNVNVLGGPNLETCGRFPGFGPPKRAGFQVWTLETCRFPGLDLPKRAGFQVWTPQVQVSRFGPR